MNYILVKLELLRNAIDYRFLLDGLTVIFKTVLITKALVADSQSGIPKQNVKAMMLRGLFSFKPL